MVLGQGAWDPFVDAVGEAWIWHRFDFQDALCTWPRRRDHSFAVLDSDVGGELVSVVPAHLSVISLGGFARWRSLESMGAPACRTDLAEGRKQKLLTAVAEYLVTLARRSGAGEVTLSIPALAPSVRGDCLPRVNPLLQLGCENTTEIRKAERAGVVVRTADQSRDLDAYYELHRQTCGRTGIRPHPRAYFEAIWRDFFSRGLAQIFVAERDGTMVAAANFAVYKNAALYWTGAACETGLELGANPLLQWRGMQWMLSQGVEWYETGEAFPNLKEGKLKQLSDFKKSFGGVLYPYYRGRLVVKPRMAALRQFARALLRGGRGL